MPTEKQAAEMWCPFVRHASDGHGTFNRGIGDDPTLVKVMPGVSYNCRCIGSRCMAWQWRAAGSGPERIGCCGLAGRGYLA